MPSPMFLDELKKLIRENNRRRANGNGPTSYETQARRAEILHQGFRTLWVLGCRLPSPWGFRERHMHKLGRYWESQAYRDIQNRLSTFRTFGNDWLHRPGMIKASELYVDNPESVKWKYVTNIDRTWAGSGVAIETDIAKIASHVLRMYCQRRKVLLITCLLVVWHLRITLYATSRPATGRVQGLSPRLRTRLSLMNSESVLRSGNQPIGHIHSFRPPGH